MPENPQSVQLEYESKQDSPVRAVGLAHRRLTWAAMLLGLSVLSFLGVSVLGGVGYSWLGKEVFDAACTGVWGLLFCSLALTAVAGRSLARRLGAEPQITRLYCVALMAPYVNLMFLWLLNRSATSYLRRAGVRVGLMGPRRADLP